MDPFSLTVGAVALVATGTDVLQSANTVRDDYCKARKQTANLRTQHVMLRENIATLSRLKSDHTAWQTSLQAIEEEFPNNIDSDSKKARLRWALKDKKKATNIVTQLKETEISTILSLQSELLKGFNEVQSMLAAKEARELEILEVLRIRGVHNLPKIGTPTQPSSQNAQTIVQRWNTSLSHYLGIEACLIVSKGDGKNKYNVFVRWPLRSWKVLNGRFASSWPSWCSLSFYPCLTVQNIVPLDSPTVGACHSGDISTLRTLLSAKKAHPNDTTEDNLTLLYFAIRGGSAQVVQLLLDQGADPNLSYGRWETSPLNSAFYYGNVEVARMLLAANSELDFVNRRLWTSPRYLFDPELSNLHTSEFLDICLCENFDQWDCQDAAGWTIFHRAAAFGRGQDIRKLLHLSACSTIRTATTNWLPIHCAIKYGNELTFDVLAELIPPHELVSLADSRGWTLLHLAAEYGSYSLIVKLLKFGLCSTLLSSASSLLVPNGLELKEVTPMDVAKACGNQESYDRALKTAEKCILDFSKENE